MAKEEDTKALMEQTVKQFGKLNILVSGVHIIKVTSNSVPVILIVVVIEGHSTCLCHQLLR